MASSLPITHFNYDILDNECNCRLCCSWRETSNQLRTSREETESHKFRCNCISCRRKQVVTRTALVAANKRDLYSELSYVVQGKKWRHEFLAWIENTINDGRLSFKWWTEIEEYPLYWWFERWAFETGLFDVKIPRFPLTMKLTTSSGKTKLIRGVLYQHKVTKLWVAHIPRKSQDYFTALVKEDCLKKALSRITESAKTPYVSVEIKINGEIFLVGS